MRSFALVNDIFVTGAGLPYRGVNNLVISLFWPIKSQTLTVPSPIPAAKNSLVLLNCKLFTGEI